MKKIVLFLYLLLPLGLCAQGSFSSYLHDISVVASDYETASKKFDAGKKETLHAVRSYIQAKEALLNDVEEKMEMVAKNRSANMIDTTIGQKYLGVVDSADEEMNINSRIKHLLMNLGYMAQLYGEKKIADLDPITMVIRKKVSEVKKDDEAMEVLLISKKNIKNDISNAQLRIDSLYGQLYDDGNFKVWITGIFSSIVGALLLFFFVFITRMSETNLAKDFLSSGNGLQFITLFSLIIAIILFGVLGVLEGRELAAILSGISGYILGKGIIKPTESHVRVDKQHAAPPADTKEGK